MSDGDRYLRIAYRAVAALAFAFAILAVIWGWDYGLKQERLYEQEARQAHANHTKHACEQVNQAGDTLTTVQQADGKPCTPSEKAKQENDNRRDYADLVAQRTSALWAKIMGIAALIGMGLSGVGIILIWTTFRETQKSNKIAEKAERPFAFFHLTKKEKRDDGTITKVNGVTFKNFGKSPAFVRDIIMDLGFFERPPNPSTAKTHYVMPQPHVIPTDGEWPYNHYFPPNGLDERMAEYVAGRRGLYLYGRITYWDAHQTIHETWFSRVFDGRSFVFGIEPEHEDLLRPELNGYN